MSRLMLVPLVIPFACLATLSSIAFFAVMAIGGALRSVDAIRWSVGLGSLTRTDRPTNGMVRDAHPLDFIEKQTD
jgi:hypothetical protein